MLEQPSWKFVLVRAGTFSHYCEEAITPASVERVVYTKCNNILARKVLIGDDIDVSLIISQITEQLSSDMCNGKHPCSITCIFCNNVSDMAYAIFHDPLDGLVNLSTVSIFVTASRGRFNLQYPPFA